VIGLEHVSLAGAFRLDGGTTGSTVISALETINDMWTEALIAERKFRIIRFIERQKIS